MKILAFYLPQFHTIFENDVWWGKGFTEWTNVRRAKPIYKGQYQPRVPLNNNYYDLSKVETLKWQIDLAKKYQIYGFCIYHYWFNGKMLLEKPAEMLLANPQLSINFCFSWANEPWSRTWDGKSHQVLMPQEYGDEKEWKEHFDYLLPFFKDPRYIKENNKPMFLIYKSSSIVKCKEMMTFFDILAKKAGFDGMHFVETLIKLRPEKRLLPFSAKVEYEPIGVSNSIQRSYNAFRRYIVGWFNNVFHTKIPKNPKRLFKDEVKTTLSNTATEGTYAGAFLGWDNTARRYLTATYITSPTKEELKDYLKKKIEIGRNIYKTDYLFINAWNEWAEGTYLEPDERHRYEYLEAVKEVLEEKK